MFLPRWTQGKEARSDPSISNQARHASKLRDAFSRGTRTPKRCALGHVSDIGKMRLSSKANKCSAGWVVVSWGACWWWWWWWWIDLLASWTSRPPESLVHAPPPTRPLNPGDPRWATMKQLALCYYRARLEIGGGKRAIKMWKGHGEKGKANASKRRDKSRVWLNGSRWIVRDGSLLSFPSGAVLIDAVDDEKAIWHSYGSRVRCTVPECHFVEMRCWGKETAPPSMGRMYRKECEILFFSPFCADPVQSRLHRTMGPTIPCRGATRQQQDMSVGREKERGAEDTDPLAIHRIGMHSRWRNEQCMPTEREESNSRPRPIFGLREVCSARMSGFPSLQRLRQW